MAASEPAGLVLEGVCMGCGNPTRVDLDVSAPEWVRRIARQQNEDGQLMCAACDETVEREREQFEARIRAAERLERRRELAALPPQWRTQAFGSLEEDEPRLRALLRAREWAAGEVRGLVLWGPVGTGKTAIAAAAANAAMEVGRAVRWLSVAELLKDLRMPFSSPEYVAAQRRLDAARGRVALVLDDLDKVRATDFSIEPLYIAVNGWIEAELPLLVTLNRDLDELVGWLPESFGHPLGSRLAGYCKVQHVGGNDRRLEP